MEETKQVLNQLFVDVFNQFLALEDRVVAKGSGYKISMTETHVLDAIDKCDLPTMGAVASRLSVTPGTLTTSVNKLIDKDFVTRARDLDDRRIVTLSLTDRGREVCKLHEEFHEELMEVALKDLENRDDLMKALESINRFFQNLREKHDINNK